MALLIVVRFDGYCSAEILPYVVFGLLTANLVATYVTYDFCPARLTVPLGIGGWIATFTMLYLRTAGRI